MRAIGGSFRPWHRGLVVSLSLLGALVAGVAIMAVGSVAAGGIPLTSHAGRAHTYNFDTPTSAALVGSDLFITNAGNNSVTEINASDGSYRSTISGARFGFDAPTAIAAVGNDLFVANSANNSLTEFRAAGHKHIRTIRGTGYGFADPIALASSGADLFVLNGAGSVTEVATATGSLVAVATGSTFGFDVPTGLTVADGQIFVSNSAGDTVTVLSASTMMFVASLSGTSFAFNIPTGVAFDGINVWVTNYGASSVTEISPTTLTELNVLVSSNLPMVGPIAFGAGYVFTVSPWGSSPMVSQISVSPPTVNWMMCNTNGPYLFNNPQALVVAGTDLWVVNEGGNSLTEMDTVTGSLMRTVSNS